MSNRIFRKSTLSRRALVKAWSREILVLAHEAAHQPLDLETYQQMGWNEGLRVETSVDF